jgi:hypothetical protein
MDPPKVMHVKPDKSVWRPPKHTPVTTYISAVAEKKETSAENHKPKPPGHHIHGSFVSARQINTALPLAFIR